MLQLFEKHIRDNLPFIQRENLLIACSGGIDSMVLTHLLKGIKAEITIVHCNFHLRGKASDLDQKFVMDQGKKMNVPVLINQFETEKHALKYELSIQMAARELRYQWFHQLIQDFEFDYLLTAHHADDNLETFLINFSRGTGLEGLTGIPERNNKIIRPLLPFKRSDIETFAKNNKIAWREDLSNTETKYLRNKLRHDIIPSLKELNPNLTGSFLRTIENLQGSQSIVKEAVDRFKKEVFAYEKELIRIDIDKIKERPNPKAYLFELLKEFGFTEWDDLVNLMEGQSGKQLYSKSHRLLKDRSCFLLTERHEMNDLVEFNIDEHMRVFSTSLGIDFKFEDCDQGNFDRSLKNIVHVDKALLKYPLVVRKWKKGDYFYPIGLKGRKKLSKFFKDEKIPIYEKEKTWLLCTVNNEIVWVVNHRLDNRFKITNSTTEILKIEV